MTEVSQYSILFKGEALDDVELEHEKNNFAKLFNADVALLEKLFSGRVVTLKQALDKQDALKFQRLFKQAGAKIYIKASEQQNPSNQAPDSATKQAQVPQSKMPEKPDQSKESEQPKQIQARVATEEPSTQTAYNQTTTLSLLPPGSPMLELSERQEFHELELDLSQYSLAELGALIDQLPNPQTLLNPSTDHLSTAEPGAVILPEHKEPSPVVVNTDHLSLAEVGALLRQEIDDIPDFPPETSHLSLAEVGAQIDNLIEDKTELDPDISHLSVEDK